MSGHLQTIRRNLLLSIVAVVGLWFCSRPLSAETPSQHDAAEEQNEFPWHLVNSAIFAAGFAYAIWKYAPAFFNARSGDIQRAIKDATGLKIEADFRHSEIDRKMGSLPSEVKRLREQAKVEMDREAERRKQETHHELEHIEASLQTEIALSRAEAESRMRRNTALMALQNAESQLQDRAGAGSSDGLVGDFVHLVEQGGRS